MWTFGFRFVFMKFEATMGKGIATTLPNGSKAVSGGVKNQYSSRCQTTTSPALKQRVLLPGKEESFLVVLFKIYHKIIPLFILKKRWQLRTQSKYASTQRKPVKMLFFTCILRFN
jgi:hypothetical protein